MKIDGKKKELVVIGNGMAGVAAVEEIIRLAPERYNITILGKEEHPNYNRVLLADLLTGEKELSELTLNAFSWYKKNGIKLKSGSPVKKISRGERTVTSEDGTTVNYDVLIIATGSLPFMPSVDGIDKTGVMTFRDINDCERIRESAGSAQRAVVVGGGILGLEAAYGLKKLEMDVTIVHLMDRLMERQLDEVAAAYLKEDLEALGMEVLLSKETVGIGGNGSVDSIHFKDGGSVETDMVVMAAGIKPNIELAAASGIYCERGIVVSDTMQTYDPAVYAVGECVEHRGSTFGLVAQVFDHAKVLANHLAGDSRMVFKNKPVSTRLKIPGVPIFSAGRVPAAGDGGADGVIDTIDYHDHGARVYKRLFIKDNTLDGVVMYGDVVDGPALFQRIMDGGDISTKRKELLLGSGPGGRGGGDAVDALPDEAIICGCKGITKAMIVDSVKTEGLFTLDDVKRETGASTSCGGCSDLIERILQATLGSSFKEESGERSICGCTKYTRSDIIKNIREKALKSVGDVMETLGWESVGCDECRPAINYYVSVIWSKDYKNDPTSRLVNERMHANIQKDETFSVVPRLYGGVATAAELKRIAEVAERFDVPLIKLTGGQRIDLVGIERDDLVSVWEALDMPCGYAYGKALRTVKTCVGSLHCRYGTQDSLSLGRSLEKKLDGLWMPAKVKLGVTGCPRNCAESAIKDLGIVGVSGGFEIYVGGCGGIKLRGGELLCTAGTEEEASEITCAFIQYYREDAVYGERSFKWIDRVGLGKIKEVVVADAEERKRLAIKIEAEAALAKDPWEERVKAH